MALNGSGPISLGGSTTGESIAVELGLSPTAQISLNDGDVRDLADVPSGAIVMPGDFYGKSNIIPAPVGLIVPYTSASIPSGWSRFTSADNRFIVGAGSSYAAGATGGSSSTPFSGTTSSAGSHPGGNHPNSPGAQSGGGAGSRASGSGNTAGAHTHTFDVPISPSEDVYKNFVLIKCTSSGVQLPQNAMLLATTSLSGLTNVETTTDRFLRSASSYGGTGGSASLAGSVTSSSSGSHSHANAGNQSGGYSGGEHISAGAHTHSASLTGTLNTKRMYVSAWTNASANYDLVANGIAMWESATPPSGWSICNGAGGTPDLRDFFIRIGTTGNHGTTSGNNIAPWSVSASGNAPHSHFSPRSTDYARDNAAGPFSWPHSHSGSDSTTVVPPYYALYFIKYNG